MTPPPTHADPRRAAARRTAWIVGAIAVLIYVAFLASGVLGP
jgi:hypothetical protein